MSTEEKNRRAYRDVCNHEDASMPGDPEYMDKYLFWMDVSTVNPDLTPEL